MWCFVQFKYSKNRIVLIKYARHILTWPLYFSLLVLWLKLSLVIAFDKLVACGSMEIPCSHFLQGKDLQALTFSMPKLHVSYSNFSLFFQVIGLQTQLSYFKEAETQLRQELGKARAEWTMSRGVYMFSIGSNDYMSPFLTNSTILSSYSKSKYVGMVIGNLTAVIKVRGAIISAFYWWLEPWQFYISFRHPFGCWIARLVR